MLKRLCLLSGFLLAAYPATAGTIVTWQADGTVTGRTDRLVPPEPGVPVAPPIGTPLSLTLNFDPSSAVQTFGGVPGCTNLSVSGSVTIGGYTSALGAGSQGFTRAGLPGTNCGPSNSTQFGVFVPAAPADSPFALPAGLLVLSYRDLLLQDAFPNSPTPATLADISYLGIGAQGFDFVFRGLAELSAVDQSTPVPEPATLTLLGIGLLAAARRRRQADNEVCASPQRPPHN